MTCHEKVFNCSWSSGKKLEKYCVPLQGSLPLKGTIESGGHSRWSRILYEMPDHPLVAQHLYETMTKVRIVKDSELTQLRDANHYMLNDGKTTA